MQQAPIFLVIILGLSALLATYLAAWARLHGRAPAANEFFWLFLGVALYSLGYAVEISRTDLAGVLTALRLEYVGLAFVPALMLLFVLHFIRGKPLSVPLTAVLMVIPCITLLLVFTVDYHSLYYVNPRMINGEFFSVFDFERGLWYEVNFYYLLLLTILSLFLLVLYAFRVERKKKRQAITMAVGAFFPVFSGILYFLGLIPGNIDPTPFSLVILGVIDSFALFKLELFELVPAARELALDSILEGFLVVDRNGIVRDFNRAAQHLPDMQDLKVGDDLFESVAIGDHLKPLLDSTTSEVEFAVRFPESENHYYHASAHHIRSDLFSSEAITILIRDVTENVNLMENLKDQANLDSLTGLFNRRCLIDLGTRELERACQNGQTLGVIMMDLDHFKSINDRHGHAVGDIVLKEVASRIFKGLRDEDIYGRYGGEEFVVFLPGTNSETIMKIAERLRQRVLESQVVIEGSPISVKASFGVHVELPGKNTKLDDLLKRADQALYLAKERGRNRVCTSCECAGDPPVSF